DTAAGGVEQLAVAGICRCGGVGVEDEAGAGQRIRITGAEVDDAAQNELIFNCLNALWALRVMTAHFMP
ncbi:MAG: hypothetical protein RLZZ479_1541, partial [Bacteroidota bacterium]